MLNLYAGLQHIHEKPMKVRYNPKSFPSTLTNYTKDGLYIGLGIDWEETDEGYPAHYTVAIIINEHGVGEYVPVSNVDFGFYHDQDAHQTTQALIKARNQMSLHDENCPCPECKSSGLFEDAKKITQAHALI